MVLGTEELLKLVKQKNLVENLAPRELKNPEGAGFDLRIGKLFKTKGEGFLGIEERNTPEVEKLTQFKKGTPQKFPLKPHTYYLMKTLEKVNLPQNILGWFTPRSTLYRSGIYIFGGQIAPGYQGQLTMGLYNFRDQKFLLEMGARVLHIMFFKVKGRTRRYKGQWQGGRVTTEGKEKQI